MLVFLLLWSSFYKISATALNHLVKFLQYALFTIATNSVKLTELVAVFPTSLYLVKKYFGLLSDEFDQYVICPKCGSLYAFTECVETTATGELLPKLQICNHVAFREHPHMSRRQPCGHRLLKEVNTQKGKNYYPLKAYCYYSIRQSIAKILGRNDNLNRCEEWRRRSIPDGYLADIYEGAVWKEFMYYDGKPFLAEPHNLGLMLNCDWFQPFQHSQYSVGVFYLVILNLPRTIRFKPENIIIAGIIPGPSEPSYEEINSYLRPLVKELDLLWTEGFPMLHSNDRVIVHAALLATVCDIPATLKIGGFLSHLSKHACWKCDKNFPYNDELKRVDFSGVDVGFPRTHDEHKKNATDTLKATTPSRKSELELDKGSRFTVLMNLKYYDCVRFSIIDVMHNLYLGTAKRILRFWLDSNLLDHHSLKEVQERVTRCLSSGAIGRIPRKIALEFSNLTADEWKNWTLLCSLIALSDVLPDNHCKCWQLFVAACNILSSSVVSLNNIEEAHELMQLFFIAAEELYGPKFLTINAHLHLHLQKVYLDYGPCYGFWLFSFERYNGILGKFHTNHVSIEIQLMRRFIESMHIRSLASNDIVESEHLSLFHNFLNSTTQDASSETLFGQDNSNSHANELTTAELLQGTVEDCHIKMLPPYALHHFDSDLLPYLKSCYSHYLPDIDILEVPQLCRKYKMAQFCSHTLKGTKCTEEKFACIQAYWIGSDGKISESQENQLCTGKIEFFFTQCLLVGSEYKEVKMAKIKWFQEHHARFYMYKPVEIWCNDLYKPCGPATFMPLNKIREVCVTCEITINNEKVLALNPIRKKIFL